MWIEKHVTQDHHSASLVMQNSDPGDEFLARLNKVQEEILHYHWCQHSGPRQQHRSQRNVKVFVNKNLKDLVVSKSFV